MSSENDMRVPEVIKVYQQAEAISEKKEKPSDKILSLFTETTKTKELEREINNLNVHEISADEFQSLTKIALTTKGVSGQILLTKLGEFEKVSDFQSKAHEEAVLSLQRRKDDSSIQFFRLKDKPNSFEAMICGRKDVQYRVEVEWKDDSVSYSVAKLGKYGTIDEMVKAISEKENSKTIDPAHASAMKALQVLPQFKRSFTERDSSANLKFRPADSHNDNFFIRTSSLHNPPRVYCFTCDYMTPTNNIEKLVINVFIKDNKPAYSIDNDSQEYDVKGLISELRSRSKQI